MGSIPVAGAKKDRRQNRRSFWYPRAESIFASKASKNGFASSAQNASSLLVSGKPKDIRHRRNSRYYTFDRRQNRRSFWYPHAEPIFASKASKNGFASSAQSAPVLLVSCKPKDIRHRRNSRFYLQYIYTILFKIFSFSFIIIL